MAVKEVPLKNAPEKIQKPLKVEIVKSDYQPSKAELEADMRVDATFEEAMQALAEPVEITYTDRPSRSSQAASALFYIIPFAKACRRLARCCKKGVRPSLWLRPMRSSIVSDQVR